MTVNTINPVGRIVRGIDALSQCAGNDINLTIGLFLAAGLDFYLQIKAVNYIRKQVGQMMKSDYNNMISTVERSVDDE